MAKINPFNNVKNRSIPGIENKISGSNYFSNLRKMSVGSGTQVFRAGREGHWAGANKFADAPFSVDMQGNTIATSITITGYIPTNGALADIGTLGITTTYIANDAIETPKIAANAVIAAKISVATLSAISADVGTITAGTITGVTVTSTNAGTNRIVLDSGDYIRFYAGGTERSNIRGVTATGATGARLTGDFVLENNKSVLFEDTTAGPTKYGGMSITNSNQFWLTLGTANTFFLYDNAQATPLMTASTTQLYSEYPLVVKNTMYFGASTATNDATIFYSGSTLNINSDGTITISANSGSNNINLAKVKVTGGLRVDTGDLEFFDAKLESSGSRYVFKDNGGTEQFSITPTGSGNTKITMNGFDLRLTSSKTAVVPTSKGYKALYCIESPEVWFMDFVDDLDKEDPIFKEVTTGDVKIIELKNGGYQIWRRRDGHADYRFESKTEEEFIANENFLRQAKVIH